MAELIDKKDALEQIKSIPCTFIEEYAFQEVAERVIKRMPTTTESEIRAKAIDDVFEFLKGKRDKKKMKVGFDDLEIREYKEQLKEE